MLENNKNGMFHHQVAFWYIHTIWKHRDILAPFIYVEKGKKKKEQKFKHFKCSDRGKMTLETSEKAFKSQIKIP